MARAGQSRRRHTGFDVTGPAPEPGAQSRGGGKRRGGGDRGGRAEVGPGTHREGGGQGARPESGGGAWPEAHSRAAGVWARPGAGLTSLAGQGRPGFLLRGRRGGEGARGRGKGRNVVLDPVCRADPGLPRRRSAPSSRAARPLRRHPGPGLVGESPHLLPGSGRRSSGRERRRPLRMLPPRAPGGREASLTRVRGWRMTWMPGTLGARIREPGRRRRSPSRPTPHPQEPSPWVAAGASVAYLQPQASRRRLEASS